MEAAGQIAKFVQVPRRRFRSVRSVSILMRDFLWAISQFDTPASSARSTVGIDRSRGSSHLVSTTTAVAEQLTTTRTLIGASLQRHSRPKEGRGRDQIMGHPYHQPSSKKRGADIILANSATGPAPPGKSAIATSSVDARPDSTGECKIHMRLQHASAELVIRSGSPIRQL
jgi:hypothetical protein